MGLRSRTEAQLQGWVLRLDYVGSHTLRINRPLDVDPPAPFIRTAPGQTRTRASCQLHASLLGLAGTASTAWPATPLAATNPQPPYSVIQSDVNDGYAYYDSLQVNLTGHIGRRLTMLASYTWSHTIDNVDPDTPARIPTTPTSPASWRMPMRFSISGSALFSAVSGAVRGDSTSAEFPP